MTEAPGISIYLISNGFAVYIGPLYDLRNDAKSLPHVVFNDKEQLTAWLLTHWNPVSNR